MLLTWVLVIFVSQETSVTLHEAPPLSKINEDTVFSWDVALVESLREAKDFEMALLLIADLAKRYPAENPQLAFEEARILVDQSSTEPDPVFRERQRRKARASLEMVITAGANAPKGLEASVWLARVDMQLARAMLARVLPLVGLPAGNAAAQKEKEKTRRALSDSAERLGVAVKAMRKAGFENDSMKQQMDRLEVLLERCDLEVALCHFDAARTFNAQREADARLIEVNKAKSALEKIKSMEDGGTISWVASAYLGLLFRENGEPQKGRLELKPLLAAIGPEKAEARRLARLFNMEILLKDGFEPTEKINRLPEQVVEDLGFNWLGDYRRYSATPEANAVRMLTAEAIVAQLKKVPKTTSNQRLREDRFNQVRRLIREIERGDNEYTEKARRLKIAILQEQGAFSRKLEDLKSFDDCLARAQFELVQLADDLVDAKDSSARRQIERKHEEVALAALRRALQLNEGAKAQDKALPEEANLCRYTRVYLASALGLHDEAVREGENFARNDPRPSQAIISGAVALQSHLALMDEARRKVAGLDGMEKGGQTVDPFVRQSTLKQVADAAASMEQFAIYLAGRWPEEELASNAVFQIGMVRARSGKTGDALEMFGRVRANSRLYPLALNQSALLHFLLAGAKGADPDTKAKEVAKSVELLQRIPALLDMNDKGLTDNFLQSRLRLAAEYYNAKDFTKLTGLLSELDGVAARLDEDSRNAYGALLDKADLYSILLGMSQSASQKEASSQADALDPALRRLGKAKSFLGAKPTVMGFLERVLVAALLGGKEEILSRALTTTLSLTGNMPQEEDSQNLARMFLGATRRIVGTVAESSPAARDELSTKVVAMLGAVPVGGVTGDSSRRMMASAYESAGMLQIDGSKTFAKAIALLEPIAKPMWEDPATLVGSKDKQVLAVSYLRLLRLTGQIGQERGFLDTAMVPSAWGGRSLDVAIEDIHVLFLEKKFGLAARKAKPLVEQMEKKLPVDVTQLAAADKVIIDRYMEVSTLQIQAFFGYGMANQDAPSLMRAAALLVDLEKRPWFRDSAGIWRRSLKDLQTQNADFLERCEKFRKGG